MQRPTSHGIQRTIERSFVGDIVHQQDPHGTTVVGRGYSSEPFLAGGVPDLQLDTLAIELDSSDFEVDANRRDEGRSKRVLAEAQ